MIEMTLAEVADVVGGTAHGDAVVTGGAFLDTRNPEPGGLFVALAGDRVDEPRPDRTPHAVSLGLTAGLGQRSSETQDARAQSPSTSASAVSRSRSSLALRRPTDSPRRSGLTAVVCSTSTRVEEPSRPIVGRNDRGAAVVDVGETSTVESASSSSACTTTA